MNTQVELDQLVDKEGTIVFNVERRVNGILRDTAIIDVETCYEGCYLVYTYAEYAVKGSRGMKDLEFADKDDAIEAARKKAHAYEAFFKSL